jgi:hypothetical protein
MVDLFCIASGPSLTAEDCAVVAKSGKKICAVNNSWQMFLRCDYIYAGDYKWWVAYHNKITIEAERWSSAISANRMYGVKYHPVTGAAYNSGMRAIQFGAFIGYKTIALLGYDCSLKNGLHWHGAHTGPRLRNPTELKMKKWHSQFASIKPQLKKQGVVIYNCSRYTELGCFEKKSLEEVLGMK